MSKDAYSDDETARRRDEVIKRMLNTPPQPHRAKKQPKNAKGKVTPKARSKPRS
jgi:hypothetical protein